MATPLVSIILPVFNGFPFLPLAIKSLLQQSHKNIEILILDDGSTDQTPDIISYFSQIDSRIRVFSQNNHGLTASLNRLIYLSRGKYIARQDADDISFTFRISSQLKLLEKHSLDFVTCRSCIASSTSPVPTFAHLLPTWITLLFGNPFIHGTLFIRKEVLLALSGYDQKFLVSQDYDLFSRLVYGGFRFKYISKPFYFLRLHPNSVSSSRRHEQLLASRSISSSNRRNLFSFIQSFLLKS